MHNFGQGKNGKAALLAGIGAGIVTQFIQWFWGAAHIAQNLGGKLGLVGQLSMEAMATYTAGVYAAIGASYLD